MLNGRIVNIKDVRFNKAFTVLEIFWDFIGISTLSKILMRRM